jgi:hypothetical protein
MAAWVSADQILGAVGVTLPADAESTAWAEACAAAVSAGIDARLVGVPMLNALDVDVSLYPELVFSATVAGAEAYKRREAVYGLTGYVDLEGVAPIIARYATFGIA